MNSNYGSSENRIRVIGARPMNCDERKLDEKEN